MKLILAILNGFIIIICLLVAREHTEKDWYIWIPYAVLIVWIAIYSRLITLL